jgi:hypothetical protein
MNNDSVTAAFEIILDEINSVITEVNLQGADFMKTSDYTKARSLMDTGIKLRNFHHKLQELKQEWVSGLDEPIRRQVNVETSSVTKTIKSGNKKAKTGILVKYEDGTVLSGGIAGLTFAKAIKKLDFNRVMELEEKIYYLPLIAKIKQGDKYNATELDGYFVITHMSTVDMRYRLLKIAKSLKVKISVQIVK